MASNPRRTRDITLIVWALVVGGLSARAGTWQPLVFQAAIWVPIVVLGVSSKMWRWAAHWRLMGTGVALFAIGDATWDLLEAFGREPDVSVADLVYLAGYVLLAAGLIRLLRTGGGPQRREGLIDGVLVAIPAMILIAEFLVVPADDESQRLLVRAVTGAYPLADGLLVAGLVWLLAVPGLTRRCTIPLAAGMAGTLVLDILWAVGSQVGNDGLTSIVDALYPVTYAVLFVGITAGATAPAVVASQRTSVPWGRVILLGAGVVAAPMACVLGLIYHQRLPPVVVVIATLTAAVLVVARFVRLIEDLNDITAELTAARNELQEQAVIDPLTGLFNRLVLSEQLPTVGSGAALWIDLDHFKRINDTYGHHAGDAVLGKVAERLQAETRSDDAVVRMGGDEFLVILREVDRPTAVDLAERVVAAIEQPIEVLGLVLEVSASVGVALVDAGAPPVEIDELLQRADVAMYDAKREGSGRVHLAAAHAVPA